MKITFTPGVKPYNGAVVRMSMDETRPHLVIDAKGGKDGLNWIAWVKKAIHIDTEGKDIDGISVQIGQDSQTSMDILKTMKLDSGAKSDSPSLTAFCIFRLTDALSPDDRSLLRSALIWGALYGWYFVIIQDSEETPNLTTPRLKVSGKRATLYRRGGDPDIEVLIRGS